MTTLSFKSMDFGPEILGICQHLNLYAPIFLLEVVETRGADDYWEAKVSLLGSAHKPEREITKTFEVHAEAKEQCLRIAAHKALGRLVCRYSARLEGTVYKEMTKISWTSRVSLFCKTGRNGIQGDDQDIFKLKYIVEEVQAY